jgi:hypothetical protein
MAMMFKVALERLANGEHGQVMPVTLKGHGPDGTPRETVAFELQWLERQGIDPEDTILCRYRVRDPEDVQRIKDAFARRTAIQDLAKLHVYT